MSNFTETFPTSADDARIPESLRELVNAELNDGETIRWIDQPAPAFFSNETFTVFLWGFAVQFIATFIFFAANGVEDGFWAILPIITVASSAMGASIMFGAWLGLRIRARHTVYIVTNVRAIIAYKLPFILNVTSYYLSELSYLFREQTNRRRGNICFREEGWFLLPPFRQEYYRRGFLNIRNVQEVERLIQELKGKYSSDSAFTFAAR